MPRFSVFLSLRVALPTAIMLMTAPAATAQVLQLPTFQSFSTDSSVMVPDRGTASLGGITRLSTGSNQFGPPFFAGNRSSGTQAGAAGFNVGVKIHDFEAMDRALLQRPTDVAGQDSPIAPADDRSGTTGPLASVAELAARKAAAEAVEEAEARKLLERGLKAQADGKPGAAKVYLQMAAKRSTGNLKQKILAALANAQIDLAPPRVSQHHGNGSSNAVPSPVRN